MGNKPKPPELRLIEGNRGHRPIPVTPKPKREHPPASRWITREAKREWRRISKELFSLGLLTVVDRAALEAYCQCYARWKEAEAKVDMVCPETESGYLQQNPYIGISLKYVKEMRAFLTEFGMTPSSRARVNVEKLKDTKSEFERLLGVR